MGVFFMKGIVSHSLPVKSRILTGKTSIEERAIQIAQYIIDSKDTVRGAAQKFGISKSTVHTDVKKGEIFKIPSIILLSGGTSYSPQARVKIAVKV